MSPRKKKPVQAPPPAEAALEAAAPLATPPGEAPEAAPLTGEAPEGEARVAVIASADTTETTEPEAPETATGEAAPGEGQAPGEIIEPDAWAEGTAAKQEFSGQGEEEVPAEETGGAVIEAIESPAPGENEEKDEDAAQENEAAPQGEEPRAEEPRIETIEAPAHTESPGLEESDEVEEAEGEVLDTELSRVLSTPTGLRSAIEALLFVTPEPLTPHRIARALEMNDTKIVMTILTELKIDYDDQKRGFQIIETAEGYQMASREVFGDLILRLKNRKRRPSLSQAALETLAIIAYRQPIIRAEVEAVRGVESSGTIRNLIDMGMVEMVGRKEVLGRPPMYGTTEQFLQSFGLRNLADLPAIGELKRRFAESENKPAETAKTEAPAAAAAADAAAAESPFQGDLPGQMYIEVPAAPNPEAAPAGTPDGHDGNGNHEAPQDLENQFDEPDDEDAEPEQATLAASADAPVPDGNEAAPDRKTQTAGEPGREGDEMSDREKWEAEEEEEFEDEDDFEDDDELGDEEDEDEEEDDDDDAEYDEDDELDDEDDDEDEDDDDEEDDEEDEEDDDEELEDEEDEEDYEDEDEEDEDEDEEDDEDDEDEDEDDEEEDEDEGPRRKKR